MRCPECKAEVPDHLSLCPECGEMIQDTRPSRRVRRSKRASETAPGERPPIWKPMLRIFLLIAGALAILALSVFLGGYFGLHQGEIERREKRLDEANGYYEQGVAYLENGQYRFAVAAFEQALKLNPQHPYAQQRIDEVVAQRYTAGLEYLNAGEFTLAIAEFEYVLRIKPGHPYAQQGITEAQKRLAASLTPTAVDYEAVKSTLYQQALAQYEAEEWEEAAATLTQLRAIDPTYETGTVEEMLFNSLYNAGMEALLDEENPRLEEGIFYLDQAEALRPLDEEAQHQRDLAKLYMTAMGYWEVDWERCIARFETLRAIAPGYRDVGQRLYLAHVAYGDAWYGKNEMCPAEEQYTLALNMSENEEVRSKRDQAAEICLIATPTPIESLAGTEVITLTELPLGFTTGRLAYPAYNASTGSYDIYVLSTDRRIVRWAAGADQPCWMWSTGALGYRDQASPGISLLASEAAAPQQLRPGGGVVWPTFSPDGGRMAYATQDASGVWRIYIVPVDGSAEPQAHAVGKWPTWANNGWLAWTGCDDSGACGIFIDNPDDDQAPIQLSTSTNDIALSWHPDGGSLIYMANHTGNWEVFRVYTDRRFLQLTDDLASDGLPVWSPDGSKIAFISKRSGEWGVYLMESSGEDQHIILKLGPDMPNWTSQRLAWGP